MKTFQKGNGKLMIWNNVIIWASMLIILLGINGCQTEKINLHPVTYAQFEVFVDSTGYITDAERYGWSIVQVNVYEFIKVDSANWRKPDGVHHPVAKELPVTQVSYNDAIAYCQWSGTRLPTYEEYWELVKADTRLVVADNILPISEVAKVNVLGNVWDITEAEKGNSVRLAGGSLFCSENTCHGTVQEKQLFVDKETGNIHIGFSVIK